MPRKRTTEVEPGKPTPEAIFGEVVKEKRTALGLRQVDLAVEGGISQVQISRIEAGQHQACLKGILQIAEALEVSCAELMGEWEMRLKSSILD